MVFRLEIPFEAIYFLHLQGHRVSQASADFLLGLIFGPEDTGSMLRTAQHCNQEHRSLY
jgi:hypothetical protein